MGNDHPASDHSQPVPDTVDDAFLVLRDRDRRYALYFLLEHETASVETIADIVTGWARASESGTAGKAAREEVYLNLVHRHVPMMVDAGVVAYDEEAESLSLAPCPEATRSFVRRASLDELRS